MKTAYPPNCATAALGVVCRLAIALTYLCLPLGGVDADETGLDLTLVSSWAPATGNMRSVEVKDGLAYCSFYHSGLAVLDISNPTNLTWVGGDDAFIGAGPMVIIGDHLYASDFAGLKIVDIRNPENLNVVGFCDCALNTQDAYGIAIQGNYAYLCDGVNGMHVIDVENPANPHVVGHFAVESMPHPSVAWADDVAVLGNLAFVAYGGEGLQIVDISDPQNPRRTGGFPTGRHALAVAIAGEQVFVVSGRSQEDGPKQGAGLLILDISDRATPVQVGYYPHPNARGIAVEGNRAYLTVGSDGLLVLDITDPRTPSRIGAFAGGGSADEIAVAGEYVFLPSYDVGLRVIQITPVTELRIGSAIVLSDGRLQLQLTGASGQGVRVQRSTGLVDWEDWKTVTLDDGAIELTDDPVGASQRFYRAVEDTSKPEP